MNKKEYVHGYNSSRSAVGHPKLWCEHSVGICCQPLADFLNWLILRVIDEIPHSLLRGKS